MMRRAAAIFGVVAYTVFFFVQVPHDWGKSLARILNAPSDYFYTTFFRWANAWSLKPADAWAWGGYCVFAAIALPWAAMAVLKRWRPRDIGLRWPNVLGWRYLLVGYVVSLPFVIWMALSPGFAPYYQDQLAHGMATFLALYLVVMLGEHFLMHGVMLAALSPDMHWPEALPPPGLPRSAGRIRRSLAWLGLGRHNHPSADPIGVMRVLGLRPGMISVLVVSALMFYAVHIGKDEREALLSLPGGLAIAYVALRSNSLLTPLLLHLATAATACAVMLAGGATGAKG